MRHHGRRPYTCGFCSVQSWNKGKVRAHILWIHGLLESELFYGKKCPYAITHLNNLRTQIFLFHGDRRQNFVRNKKSGSEERSSISPSKTVQAADTGYFVNLMRWVRCWKEGTCSLKSLLRSTLLSTSPGNHMFANLTNNFRSRPDLQKSWDVDNCTGHDEDEAGGGGEDSGQNVPRQQFQQDARQVPSPEVDPKLSREFKHSPSPNLAPSMFFSTALIPASIWSTSSGHGMDGVQNSSGQSFSQPTLQRGNPPGPPGQAPAHRAEYEQEYSLVPQPNGTTVPEKQQPQATGNTENGQHHLGTAWPTNSATMLNPCMPPGGQSSRLTPLLGDNPPDYHGDSAPGGLSSRRANPPSRHSSKGQHNVCPAHRVEHGAITGHLSMERECNTLKKQKLLGMIWPRCRKKHSASKTDLIAHGNYTGINYWDQLLAHFEN